MSRLAIAETALATAALAVACVAAENTWPLLAAIVWTPLLLLRTDLATEYASRMSENAQFATIVTFGSRLPLIAVSTGGVLGGMIGGAVGLVHLLDGAIFSALSSVVLGLLAGATVCFLLLVLLYLGIMWVGNLTIRILAIAGATLRQPRQAMLAIPRNWRKLCFDIDLTCWPQAHPGSDIFTGQGSRVSWSDFRKSVGRLTIATFADADIKEHRSEEELEEKFRNAFPPLRFYFGVVYPALIAVLLYLFSISYRFTVKSTCLAFLPLLYLSGDSIEKESDRSFCRATRAASVPFSFANFTVASHILLPLTIVFGLGMASLYAPATGWTAGHALLSYFSFFPPTMTLTSLAKIACAAITYVSVPFAGLCLSRMRRLNTGSSRLCTALRGMLMLRALLTIYSILCLAVLLSHFSRTPEFHAGLAFVVDYLRSLRIDLTLWPQPNH